MVPNPMSPYALQKRVSEQYAEMYYKIYGLETICLRYFNVFGPRQDPESNYACLIPKTIYRLINNEQPIIYGDGEQCRDFNFINDVVQATLLAGFTTNSAVFGETLNIGSGNSYSVNKVVRIIKKILGKNNIASEYTDPVIEPRITMAAISLIKKQLKWLPRFSFEEGLEKTCNYFKEIYNAETTHNKK
jgi:UDP-glucose 4-epimerase